jgi:RNA polymerase sigma factor (sigma-70 family)
MLVGAMTSTQNPQALLEQTGWIHALARRLVADPHLAADLAQETCVDAIERQPDALRPLRGWLAAVMRNNLAKLRRGEGNRAARERAAGGAEPAPSAHDVVEKAESHRNVVLAVLALDEPYRSTLLMRFFEQLSYAEIAHRTGATRAGVNSRVTRGLELLRARLETTYGGDRRALHLALIPLAKLPTGVATTLLGVKTMHLAIGTAAAAALAVTVSIGVTTGGREAREPAVLPVAAALEPVREPARDELQPPQQFLDPAVEPARVELAPQEKEKAKKKQKEDDSNVWKTELFDARVLPETVTSLAVNTGSGDIEVLESQSGRLEILAKVRARLGKVKDEELTQVFDDHVDVFEEDGVLKIEDAHEDGGWTVSFVVHAPGRLPLDANSGSGDVVVRRAAGKVGANTGSGDVRVELAAERVQALRANTGSGDVVVEVGAVEGKLEANTGSGDVTVRVVEPDSPGAAGLNSGSGDVLLIVPPAVSGSFDLETHGDGVTLPRSFGIQVEVDDGHYKARGSVGNGGGKYVLRSGSGELAVELGNALPAEPR